ncbi:hypothetical protein DM02DRAFT_660274 [Periconia macrospinosa]|uniref:Uncharacterized protein n=1 Tax=Periconia macrospinosa TaxID=97972 RepID=A0A2V1DDK5_9PLEO|nr:hypothetical protein DM02DRAFT_660274 [Periconia macrospinosa]
MFNAHVSLARRLFLSHGSGIVSAVGPHAKCPFDVNETAKCFFTGASSQRMHERTSNHLHEPGGPGIQATILLYLARSLVLYTGQFWLAVKVSFRGEVGAMWGMTKASSEQGTGHPIGGREIPIGSSTANIGDPSPFSLNSAFGRTQDEGLLLKLLQAFTARDITFMGKMIVP